MKTETINSSPNAQAKSMVGKVVLITGATSGIGLSTSRALAEKGARLVIVGRDLEKITSAVNNIREEVKNSDIDTLLADLSSLDEVRDLTNEFKNRYDRLDVLINNAGAIFFTRVLTIDGYEKTFALNHLSNFLLTNLLLDKIILTARNTGEARIVNVSSDAHRGGKIYFDDLMFEQRRYGIGGWRAYNQSKLANILFTFELARRLGETNVSVNALHPGFVASNLGKNNGLLGKMGMKLAQIFATTPEIGAQTSIYLASWPDVKGMTGKYFTKCQEVPADPAAYNLETARKLWDISEELVG